MFMMLKICMKTDSCAFGNQLIVRLHLILPALGYLSLDVNQRIIYPKTMLTILIDTNNRNLKLVTE